MFILFKTIPFLQYQSLKIAIIKQLFINFPNHLIANLIAV